MFMLLVNTERYDTSSYLIMNNVILRCTHAYLDPGQTIK